MKNSSIDRIDYSSLDNKIYKKAYRLSKEEAKEHLESLGFDIVRFKDADKGADLWQVQSAEDGDYIVALYQPDEENKITANWDVSISKIAGTVQISYKGDPFVKMAVNKLGIPHDEIHRVEEYLPAKLAENKKLVRALLNTMPASAKKEALNKYPELI